MHLSNSVDMILTSSSLIIAGISVSLDIRKVWSCKHEKVVAESFSLSGRFLVFIVLIPFLFNYLLLFDFQSLLLSIILFINHFFFCLVAMGFWVKYPVPKGLWQKICDAFFQEIKGLGILVKALIKPSEKKQLSKVLHCLTGLTLRQDAIANQSIKIFTDTWNLKKQDRVTFELPLKRINKLKYLSQEIKAYLALEPANEQVEWLDDLRRIIIQLDQEITSEEQKIISEINELLKQYIEQKANSPIYCIIIHPKNPDQQQACLEQFPQATCESLGGIEMVKAGCYFTKHYAEIMSESFRQQGWFTVVWSNHHQKSYSV